MDLVSPLHEACLGGHYACAMFLLENGANVRTFQAHFHSMCKAFKITLLRRIHNLTSATYKCTTKLFDIVSFQMVQDDL